MVLQSILQKPPLLLTIGVYAGQGERYQLASQLALLSLQFCKIEQPGLSCSREHFFTEGGDCL